MNLLFWKKYRQVDQLAHTLADEFYSQIQPEIALQYFVEEGRNAHAPAKKSKRKKLKKNKAQESNQQKMVDDILILVVRKIQEARHAYGLGVYGKARLHMKLRQRLIDLGYSRELAHQVNQYLMVNSA